MAFLAVAIFGLIVLVRTVIIGGASADGQSFRRDRQPLLFWTILSVGAVIDILLFYLAYRDFTY